MCFEADFFGQLIGGQKSVDVPNRLFLRAPQHALYPDSSAQPSAASVTSFLKANGIGYIYADALHPNSLVARCDPNCHERRDAGASHPLTFRVSVAVGRPPP